MKIHEGQSLWLNSPPVPSPCKIEHRTELPRKSQQLLSSSSSNRFVHQTQLTFQWRFHSPVAPTPGCWWSRPTPGIAAWQRNSDRRLGIRSGLVRPGQEAKPQSGPPYAQPWWGSNEFVLLEESPPCSEEKRLFSWPALRVMIPSRSWAIEPCRRAQGNGGLLPPLLLSLPPSPRWRKGGEGQSGPLVECEMREREMVTRHLCDTCRSDCSQTHELQVDTDRSEVTMNFELMRQNNSWLMYAHCPAIVPFTQ